MSLRTDLNVLSKYKSAVRPLTKAVADRRTGQIAAQARTLADIMEADARKIDGPAALRQFAVFLEENNGGTP
jgi:hypothetical protein